MTRDIFKPATPKEVKERRKYAVKNGLLVTGEQERLLRSWQPWFDAVVKYKEVRGNK